jgi:hypothetical protein
MSASQPGIEEIVMVPVPRSQLTAVYKVLANPVGTPTPPMESEESVEVHGQIHGPALWTRSMMKRLEAELHIPAVRTLIGLCAQRAPKPVTFEEAIAASKVDANLLRGQLGSLTKMTNRLFGTKVWPMTVRYGEAGDAIYSMDETVAGWWIEVTG